MNYLQIVGTICDELGLVAPSSVVGTTSQQIRQIAAMVKREMRELQQNYEWTALQSEFDLFVAPPIFATGDVTQNSEFITNVQIIPNPSPNGDFNPDFGPDFSGGVSNLDQLTNAPLYLISGQFIVVNSRLTTIDAPNKTLIIDQPATGTAIGITLTISQDTYPGPSDFDRYINQTWWDRTNRWALIGPDSPQVDQWHRSGIVTIGPRRHFRQIGYNGLSATSALPLNNYRIWPAPGATDTPLDLVYEYISINTVLSAAGVPQPTFQADTDIPILDENMLILGGKWRFWQIKGFDYGALQAEAIDYIERHYANDGGAKTLSLVGSRVGLYQSLVQDGNYPGTATSGQ